MLTTCDIFSTHSKPVSFSERANWETVRFLPPWRQYRSVCNTKTKTQSFASPPPHIQLTLAIPPSNTQQINSTDTYLLKTLHSLSWLCSNLCHRQDTFLVIHLYLINNTVRLTTNNILHPLSWSNLKEALFFVLWKLFEWNSGAVKTERSWV